MTSRICNARSNVGIVLVLFFFADRSLIHDIVDAADVIHRLIDQVRRTAAFKNVRFNLTFNKETQSLRNWKEPATTELTRMSS